VEFEVILADTNAWIRYLRVGDLQLKKFLEQQRVHTSDVVFGELLLGSGLPKSFAADLALLPRLPSPSAVEVRGFIERQRTAVSGAGVGWADVQIILTAQKNGARIYTSDKSVRAVCMRIRTVRLA
jgi:predicted nucleic acid-binding protein